MAGATSALNPYEKSPYLNGFLITQFTAPTQAVISLCAGSGSMADACHALGRYIVSFFLMPCRSCFSVEIAAEQCAGIVQRLKLAESRAVLEMRSLETESRSRFLLSLII